MESLRSFKHWFDVHREKIQRDYFEFLRFRSISTDPAYREEVHACAEWLKKYLKEGGIAAETIPTPGYPLVYGEDLQASGKKTLLIYGHYDVQPVDPLELWKSDPFEPTEREGQIYARGAVDDKGQIFYAVLAAISIKQIRGSLPINLKFCIEGEEESSSVGLSKALPHLKNKLQADYLLVPDFDQFDRQTPALSLGCRGLVGLEVTLKGSSRDLHSGMYGGIAYNPNRALVELLGKLWDEEGHVQIPGFYDAVIETDPGQFDALSFGEEVGISAFGKEKERSLHEAASLRPTLELNGLSGGYAGAGIKTVIPALASAKITCRLVPDQDPEKIGHAIAAFLKQQAEPGIEVTVHIHPGGARAFRSDPTSKLASAIAAAAEEVCGRACKRLLCGGSIPIVPELIRASGAEMVGMGYGLSDDQIHAPNEHFDMKRLEKGFLTVARGMELL